MPTEADGAAGIKRAGQVLSIRLSEVPGVEVMDVVKVIPVKVIR
jgi:hypothetical protein